MDSNNHSTGLYVVDTAGAVWFAVSRDTSGSLRKDTVFYKDIRCKPEEVGTPAAGQILPAGGGGGGGAATPAPLPDLETAHSNYAAGTKTVPAGNEVVIIHNSGSASITINGVTYPAGSYFSRERLGAGLPAYEVVATDAYEVGVEHAAGKGGLPA